MKRFFNAAARGLAGITVLALVFISIYAVATAAVLPLAGLWYVGKLPPLARDISMGGAPAVITILGPACSMVCAP